MHVSALVLTCLAADGIGRREQTSTFKFQISPCSQKWQPLTETGIAANSPSRVFVMLLSAFNPAVAFVPFSHGVCFRQHSFSRGYPFCSFRLAMLYKHNHFRHRVPMTRWIAASDEDNDLKALTVNILKAKLRALGLKVSGNKAELIARLAEHASQQKLSESGQQPSEAETASQRARARRKTSDSSCVLGDRPQEHVSQQHRRGVTPEGFYEMFKQQGCIPEPIVARREIPPEARTLKAVAWNINGLRAFIKKRADVLQELVAREKPEVIGLIEHKLQEAGADSENALKELSKALPNYEISIVHCSTVKKGYSGTLFLFRKDVSKTAAVEPLDLPSATGEGRLLLAEFEALYVLLAYVPNSGDKLARLHERTEQWDVELREKLKQLTSKKPLLLLGDLNVAHRDQDIWNVEASHIAQSAGTTPEERKSFLKLLEDGFVDGFAHVHPEALGAFTYWSVRAKNRPRNRGLRLDYAVVSQSLVQNGSMPALADVFHLPDMSNGDHCPVGATILL